MALLVFLAHEPVPNSNAVSPLNTINSVVFLLTLHFLRLRVSGLLAALSSFGFLRSRFALLARRSFVDTAGRSTGARSSGRSRDLGALERVPASAERAAVLVA
jgi:hypothetical protein